jgi:hypothetical protein
MSELIPITIGDAPYFRLENLRSNSSAEMVKELVELYQDKTLHR